MIKELSNLLELIPKKYYFQKNKALGYAYELLESVHIINNSQGNIMREVQIIQKNIAMLDFSLGFFIDKKCVSIKSAQKIIYLLSEISKMTNSWISKMRDRII